MTPRTSRAVLESSAMPRASVAIFALVLAASLPQAGFAGDDFGPIRVAANRSRYVGACPVEVVFTGNINLKSPHPRGFAFNYRWVRSDGAKGPTNVVHPSPSERMLVVKEPWVAGAPGRHYDLSVTLLVNSGNTHLEQPSQVVSVTCR
jgi:lipopolysaccharide export system protein LptA